MLHNSIDVGFKAQSQPAAEMCLTLFASTRRGTRENNDVLFELVQIPSLLLF